MPPKIKVPTKTNNPEFSAPKAFDSKLTYYIHIYFNTIY